jgi:sialic acid synthase SpsE
MKKINNSFKNKTFIVAEIGNNHEGSFSVAKKLILEASKAGVDAVKFQTFITENFVNDKDKKRFKRLKKFELSKKNFIDLAKLAKKKRLKFISTPLDITSAIFLNSIVDYFKISSGDNNYFQLIEKVLSFRKPTIISTGFLSFKEIKNLILLVKKNKFPLSKLSLLHCVSAYPVEYEEANLRSISFLKKNFQTKIGYSDHTIGIEAAIVAVSFGAEIIEKHFTLDNNFSKFRDHIISSDPDEMRQLVVSIRKAEMMLGKYNKKISKNEKLNKKSTRRSIFARVDIKKNEKIDFEKIKIVRPQEGLDPFYLSKIIGKKTKKKINQNQALLKTFLK